jgi:hypothetical protein
MLSQWGLLNHTLMSLMLFSGPALRHFSLAAASARAAIA